MTQDEWKHIFSDNLVALLKERKMSQAQLVKDSGVSAGMISEYINKRSVPGLPAIINIAYALDINVDELIDFGDRII